MKNVIVDFDQTLFKTNHIVVEYMNQRWGIDSVESDYQNNNEFHKVIQRYRNDSSVTIDEVYNDYRNNLAVSEYWHSKIEPMPFMTEVVGELSKKYLLFVATKRSNNGLFLVQKIINQFIPECIRGVFCAVKHLGGSEYLMMSKRDFILGLNGESIAFIDDSLYEIEKVKDLLPTYLFDPENKNILSNGAVKVESWKKIGDILL